MAEQHFEVGVIVAKRRLKGPWLSHAWLPQAVLPAAPATSPWTRLSADEEAETFYAGAAALALHGSDTAHYRDNLASGQPSVWVSLRPVGADEVEIGSITVDPYEGEVLAEGIGEIVEAVAMHPEIQEKVAAFVAAFHVERQFFKRKRDKANPDALGRRESDRGRGGKPE